MELNSICISSSSPDGMIANGCKRAAGRHIHPSSSLYVLLHQNAELLECPICNNSMCPPIHQVFNCFGEYFCLHFGAFQLGMASVYVAFLRFMGDKNNAKKYRYSLEVGANGQKLIWEGSPRSIRDSHRKVRDSHDGLLIRRNIALFFSGGDRKELKLRVTG